MRYSQVSAYSAAAVHCKRSQLSTGWTAACIGARAGGSLYPPHPDSCLHQQENPPKSQVPFWGGLSVGLAQSWTIRQEDEFSSLSTGSLGMHVVWMASWGCPWVVPMALSDHTHRVSKVYKSRKVICCYQFLWDYMRSQSFSCYSRTELWLPLQVSGLWVVLFSYSGLGEFQDCLGLECFICWLWFFFPEVSNIWTAPSVVSIISEMVTHLSCSFLRNEKC